jgi:hypothetical protein
MNTNPVQVPEVPTLMASADELPDMLDAIIHKAFVPESAAQLPALVPTTGLEPTVIMRPDEFDKPSPEVLAMVAAEKAVEAALEHDAQHITLPEPSVVPAPQISRPAFDPSKSAALAIINAQAAAAAAPRRRITVPLDTRAVSAERPSLAERVEVQKAVQRGWWVSGLVLGGLAAIATAFAVFAFGAFQSPSSKEEVLARPPRPAKQKVVQQPAYEDEAESEDEEEALAPLVVNKPRAVKKQAARPAAAKAQPKEKASDLKRPPMAPEASAPAPTATPKQRTVAAAATPRADTRHADEPADPPEDSNARLFDER